MSAPTAPRAPLTRSDAAVAAILALMTLASFVSASGNRFINFDDPEYVTQNPQVLRGLSAEGAAWAFTTFDAANWHPVTWLSLQLDATLWHRPDGRPDWRGFHRTNVLVHAANAVLLYLALRSLTGASWPCFAVALLFAVHPLRAESVAWVSERKDVLSAFFGLLALWAYAGYARSPSLRRYLLVAVPYALSLLAKPMLVTLPFLLLVLDWWPLRRVQHAAESSASDDPRAALPAPADAGRRTRVRLVVEKVPLVALAVAASVVTFLAQSEGGAVRRADAYPAGVRVGNAVLSYATYLVETVYPVNLAIYYPHPHTAREGGLPTALVAGAGLLLLAITVAAWSLRRRAPYLLAGWLWYLGTLVPVIGLVQVGTQAHADRYTYVPQIGVLLALCWGVADAAGGRWQRVAGVGLATAAAGLALLTARQLEVWEDTVEVWKHAAEVSPGSAEVLCRLADAYRTSGEDAAALAAYREVLRRVPDSGPGHTGLGLLYLKQGDLAAAGREFETACRDAPDFPEAHTNWGIVLFKQNRFDAAARQHEEAIRLAPLLVDAYGNLGQVELARGRYERAAACYREVLRLRPADVQARANLGAALARLGRLDESLSYLTDAVARGPDNGSAHFMLALTLEARGDRQDAIRHLQLAARLNPELAGLANARLQQWRAGPAGAARP